MLNFYILEETLFLILTFSCYIRFPQFTNDFSFIMFLVSCFLMVCEGSSLIFFFFRKAICMNLTSLSTSGTALYRLMVLQWASYFYHPQRWCFNGYNQEVPQAILKYSQVWKQLQKASIAIQQFATIANFVTPYIYST